ncbi:MAG: M28 family peptidase [Armatimonadota bacterium]
MSAMTRVLAVGGILLALVTGHALAAMDYAELGRGVNAAAMARDILALEACGTRVTGYRGCEQAADLVEQRLRAIGIEELWRQEYDLPMAIDKGSRITLLEPAAEGEAVTWRRARSYELKAMWPNLVRTSHVPPGGIAGRLIHVGPGRIKDFNYKDVQGSIVLMDFNTGLSWMNAPLLGAAAVIFAEPENTVRSEAEQKFLRIPVNVPRFWIDGESAMALRAALDGATVRAAGTSGAETELRCIVECTMPWEEKHAANIIGFLPGRDPGLAREAMILQAYYDSVSAVPALSPGAENAAGLAAFLQVAESLVARRPARSVIFVVTSGHFEALAGAREFIRVLGKEPRKPRERLDTHKRATKELEELQGELDKLEGGAGRGAGRAARAGVVSGAPRRAEKMARLRYAVDRLKHDIRLHERLLEFDRVSLLMGIDLSTRSRTFGVFQIGWYYAQEHLMRFYSPIGKRMVEYAETIGPALGIDPKRAFLDGINPVKGREWHTHFPDKIAFDSEMAIRGGRAGIVFATVNDARALVDTPLDTSARLNIDNLQQQTRMLVCLVHEFLNDATHQEQALKRVRALKKLDELKDVRGSVLEFRRKKSFLPSTPVPHALVLVQGRYKMMMGVHTDIWDMAAEDSTFVLRGEMIDRAARLEAYGIEGATGDIVYAPDLGPEGEVRYPREVYGRAGLRRPVIAFPCAATSIFDLVDERYFEALEQLFVFNAEDFSEPRSYGYSLPLAATQAAEFPSYIEPCAVVYSMPDMRVQVAMGMGLIGLRMVLTNAPGAGIGPVTAPAPEAAGMIDRPRAEGYGFVASETPAIPYTPYQAAHDMWTLDEWRMGELRERGIRNQRLDTLHALAARTLAESRQALADRRYDAAMSAARHAWAYESRAYPDVQNTATDVVKGVLFYLALLLPFAYFGERLLFAIPDVRINRRVGATLLVFAVMFFLLYLVHPAFRLPRLNPLIILLAFVIMALAVIVIAIVTSKFNETLRQIKRDESGTHTADVGRWSAAAAAFTLGIANMRRRKTRTTLTCITLVLLTFTVLSFTSVRSFIRDNKIRLSYPPTYPGIMIRDRSWMPLKQQVPAIVRNEIGGDGHVAPRAWLCSPDIEKEFFVDIVSGADASKTYAANVLLGLSAEERHVTGIEEALLPGGRWFAPGEKDVCVLPESVAAKLAIAPSDVGRADVRVFGSAYRVVGLLRESEFRRLLDLDGEPLSPVNYAQLRPEIIEELKRQAAQRFQIGTQGTASLLQEYRHFAPYSLAILPYETTMRLNGTVRSVAIRYVEGVGVQEQVERLMKRLALSLYAGMGGRTYLYSSVGLTSFSGLQNLAIPILIAAMIVLNTMLGSVYERTREIGIYSSVGLAPIHVSMLFLAEASVFANIGAIIGYLLGQIVAKIIGAAGTGIELNYSSLSAVGVTVVVMGVVIASTIYPSKRAAEIATPGMERKWRVPEPEGDLMVMKLPFTFTGRDALAACAFLKEWFDEFVGYAGGDFLAENVRMELLETPLGAGSAVKLRMWLAPYDLGVSQSFELDVTPTGEQEVSDISLRLTREAGDISSWVKTNSLFLSALRKQFLIWRTVPPSQKAQYADRGQAILRGEVVEAEA